MSINMAKQRLLRCLLAVVLLSVSVAACSPEVDVERSNASGVNLKSEVNPTAGTVVFPGDRFALSEVERMHLVDADLVAYAVCAREHGVPFYAQFIGNGKAPEYSMSGGFGGPWTVEMANKYAYLGPMTEADMIGNGIISPTEKNEYVNPNESITPEDREIMSKGCRKYKTAEKFRRYSEQQGRPPAVDSLMVSNLWTKIKKDSDYNPLISDLKKCYADSGISVKPSSDAILGFTVVGADYSTINAQQIELAVRDAKCQVKIDFMQKMADIIAKVQAPIIVENLEDLTAWRKQLDEVLKEADEYIDAHQDVIWKQATS